MNNMRLTFKRERHFVKHNYIKYDKIIKVVKPFEGSDSVG